jgi:type II secretory pathway component PulF
VSEVDDTQHPDPRHLRPPTGRPAIADEAIRELPHEQVALLRVLSRCVQHRLEVAPALRALADESPGWYRSRLLQVLSCLATGMPLMESLEQTPGVLDRSAVVALRLASETGTLPEMYRAMVHGSSRQSLEEPTGVGSPGRQGVHVFVGLLVFAFVLAFTGEFLLPLYQEIAREMVPDVPVAPATMEFLFRHQEAWPFVALVIVLLAMALILATPVKSRWRRWRGGRRVDLPVQNDSVSLLSLLSIVTSSGRPISAAMATLARYHHVPSTRRGLVAACDAIRGGTDPWEALHRNDLLSTAEAQALGEAADAQTQSWLLAWLAVARHDRRSGWNRVTQQTASLLLLAAFAAGVAVLASATFQLLSNLIQALS